jgi:hypothetical protein
MERQAAQAPELRERHLNPPAADHLKLKLTCIRRFSGGLGIFFNLLKLQRCSYR